MMIEPNMKLLEAMRTEANLCYERGDDEDGNALVKSIFDQIFPGLVEEAKRNPAIIYTLIIHANTEKDQTKADHFKSILLYLKDNGVKF
tara:strand:- start:156 stop:422 length:267 start_codon:yes stop_codon:yes gene_type:complete